MLLKCNSEFKSEKKKKEKKFLLQTHLNFEAEQSPPGHPSAPILDWSVRPERLFFKESIDSFMYGHG